jgi:putative hydrolase of the HAD superfamily
MIKAILFDVDGVVVNPQLVFAKKLASDYNITTAETENFFKGIFQDCLIGKADLKKELPKYLKEWGWSETTDDLIDFWFECDSNIDQNLIKATQSLRKNGIKCYLATNQEKYRTDYMIKEMKFNEKLDGIFASCDLGYKKPDKEFFQKVADQIPAIKPDEIMFWDNTENNVEAAKKVGFDARLYKDYSDFYNQIEKCIKL